MFRCGDEQVTRWIAAATCVTAMFLATACSTTNSPSAPSQTPPFTPPAAATAPIPRAGSTSIVATVSPVRRTATETVKAAAAPGSSCTLTVKDHLAKVVVIGTKPTATTDAHGIAVWSWSVSASAPAGVYTLSVVCAPGTTSISTIDVV